MRSVPEWCGTHDDQAIPDRVFLRVWQRSDGRCSICGRLILCGETTICDHIQALGLGGSHRESNLQILCAWCHRDKSRAEVRIMRKSDRVRAKHLGRKKPRTITRWRRFNGSPVYSPRER
jgi:5-methylcytosine-specific restriction protein A